MQVAVLQTGLDTPYFWYFVAYRPESSLTILIVSKLFYCLKMKLVEKILWNFQG